MISTPRMIRLALALLLGASFAACAGDDTTDPGSDNGTTQPPPPGANEVNVDDNNFSPAVRTVSAGTTVQWTWVGSNPHTVTFDDGVGNSTQQTSGTHMRQFTTAGSFTYICTVHGRTVMSGTVVVQ